MLPYHQIKYKPYDATKRVINSQQLLQAFFFFDMKYQGWPINIFAINYDKLYQFTSFANKYNNLIEMYNSQKN